MKNIKISLFLFSFFAFIACKEEKQKPLFTGKAPSAVAQYSVENKAGAAVITYKLTDPNTAYVKAVYTLKEGVTRQAKASKYDNRITVDGFAEEKAYTVALYAVGVDEQESDPVHITVNPSRPPFKVVLDEISVAADWGGGKLQGPNTTSSKLMIGVLKKNKTTGKWEEVNVFFSEDKSYSFNFRGQKPVETEFGIFTRDQWLNFSDTVSITFEPWEEIKLPISSNTAAHFLVLPGDAIGQASYPLRRMFDGLFGSWNTGFYSVADAQWPKFITIDLLKPYQLSRFKYFQNNNLYYQSANAKQMRIWGNVTLDLNFENWTLLGDWDDWRPSKRPPSTGNGGLTEEDVIKADAGNDFDFPLDIPGVRYIRIEVVSTWEPRTQVYFPELMFWGRPTE